MTVPLPSADAAASGVVTAVGTAGDTAVGAAPGTDVGTSVGTSIDTAPRTGVDTADVPWGFVRMTGDGLLTEANRRFAGWCGQPAPALRGRHLSQLLSPASRILLQTHVLPMLRVQGFAHDIALDLVRPDRQRVPILISALRDGAQIDVTVFDATEIRRHERELVVARRAAEQSAQSLATANDRLRARTEELSLTLASIADAVVTSDSDGRITSMNPAAEVLLTRPLAELMGRRLADCGELHAVHGGRRPLPWQTSWKLPSRTVNAVELRRLDGSRRLVSATAAPLRDSAGAVSGVVWVGRDVTEVHAAAQRRAHEAAHDRLTGLLNRVEIEHRAQVLLDSQGAAAGVLCHFDIDHFDVVNDTFGLAAGDQLLVRLGERLRARLRHTDLLARTGSDEFAVVLAGCTGVDAVPLAQDLLRDIAGYRFEWDGRVHRVTVSAGLTPLSLLQPLSTAVATAHIACTAAKEAGGNRVVWSGSDDASMQERRRQMGWVGRIQQALAEERFVLYVQPIVPILPEHRVAASPPVPPHGEILLRLIEPDGTVLGPGAFLPAAERFRQMPGIDRYVVRKAFDWLVATPGVGASINISGPSFSDPAFLDDVLERFDATGLDPRRVCFELTETAAMDDRAAALVFIDKLKQRGATFALDDFGAGLSSFSYLRQLPVDVLKIDGSFVRGIGGDPINRAIVESIHRIGRLCGMSTVGEWVEDDATLQTLRAIGVDSAQGWALGRPVPVAAWATALKVS